MCAAWRLLAALTSGSYWFHLFHSLSLLHNKKYLAAATNEAMQVWTCTPGYRPCTCSLRHARTKRSAEKHIFNGRSCSLHFLMLFMAWMPFAFRCNASICRLVLNSMSRNGIWIYLNCTFAKLVFLTFFFPSSDIISWSFHWSCWLNIFF